jgi:thymidylate synthase ThyX
MAYKVEIIKDSISGCGNRITTFQIQFPRIVLSEFNTHRMFSRNFSSSRAIPTNKMIDNIINDPFVPIYWGRNEKGMSASSELDVNEKEKATEFWKDALINAIETVNNLLTLNVHKQTINRILEPWMWVTGIITATDFDNFFTLRCDEQAQPEIKYLADIMREKYIVSVPDKLNYGEWHIPMIDMHQDKVYNLQEKLKIATARMARVSYLTHDGQRDTKKDLELHDSLLKNKHMSPFEHCAVNLESNKYCANLKGWSQYRLETHLHN